MASYNNQPNQHSPTPTSGAATSPGRHPVFRGIRYRSGKWVSEIREPRKTTRIWLGTYATAEMAAAAYDVAALALKGPNTTINFPSLAESYPVPASHSAAGIREAAATAAASVRGGGLGDGNIPANGASSSVHVPGDEFVDEEALYYMPRLLEDMAEGMLVSPPPRMRSAADDEGSPENYLRNDRLWSYP